MFLLFWNVRVLYINRYHYIPLKAYLLSSLTAVVTAGTVSGVQ